MANTTQDNPKVPQYPELEWVERLTNWLDSKYRFPGTNFRFGLDPIISLVPFLGDGVSLIIQSGLALAMMRYGASGKVIVLMTLNVVLDFVIGSIPVLGWVFDFFYKASERNLRLLKEHYHKGKHQGSGAGVLVIVGLVLFLLVGLLIWAAIEIIGWIISLF